MPFSSVTDLLFVYGTLKQGNQNEYARHLHQHSTYRGQGWFTGHLYQIDWFPGAVYQAQADACVWGEIYQLHQPVAMLAYLDLYEGTDEVPPLFCRQLVPVTLDNKTIYCQTYLYNLSIIDRIPIVSGQF